ncbi:MAG: DUF1573 domain-containing protein [Saprospiraceae bacterium]|nr:DUF1573 domain-containing protein [Saprospiraceae bacterium]
MLRIIKRSCLLCLAFYACQSNQNGSEKALEEIPVQGNAAEIIRNPVSAEGTVDTANIARITFVEETYVFGTAKEGDIVTHEFQFTNTGKTALIITDARSSCGCTVPEWPKKPIAPGQSEKIKVKFNTTEKEGDQIKGIIVTANTYPSESRVYLRGTVIPKGSPNQ